MERKIGGLALIEWAAIIIPLLIVASLIAWNLTRPDYAAQALANYPGGEAALIRRLEDPRGKTPEQAKLQRELAQMMRSDRDQSRK
jgi:hypothetical protein